MYIKSKMVINIFYTLYYFQLNLSKKDWYMTQEVV